MSACTSSSADTVSTYIKPPARNNHKADPSRLSQAGRSRPLAVIPPDYPHPHRLGGSSLARECLGRPARSTWARWIATGQFPPPDKRIGRLTFWKETTIAAAAATLTGAPSQEEAVA